MKKPSSKKKADRRKALERARLILKVRSGEMTATEAAERLGISRKTYYEWENRGLQAFIAALENRGEGGRPKREIDPQKEALKQQIKALEKEKILLEERLRIHAIMEEETGGNDKPSKKKRR